ncbi:calcium-independent phospholipase A2-gamma-like [Acanthaster planci]|uniref:Calcium-independent phospholipase A2-gamma-like n=1 Tax=Acanthaster planci TaxID=133434 RepID=A0A8B7ZHA9_ACAPL|nr:calcium-independent phospholipase A2-gamma-like [Acanthaster planci]XP_022105033.1 calcium-independent phospholipase A2-gamma-like [Acanthaster planci]XP_022105034.1 calcium-independent phospholipase A2-gamma-like [Acanthaster planci]XP_022105035.1 calcium-independent phospholipase A2-gamma-like [Acanthaster planci]
MSHSYHRVALAAHKSLHGWGFVCWCSQHGKQPGTAGNPLVVLGIRPFSSKDTRSNGNIDKDAKRTGQSTLQDRFKHLKSSVAATGSRVQDSVHSSREKFLGAFFTLQAQPDNREAKHGENITGGHFSMNGESKQPDSHNPRSVPGDKECTVPAKPDSAVTETSENCKLQDKQDLTPPEDTSKRFAQKDFWVNIPSFQDRINRLKAPFLGSASTQRGGDGVTGAKPEDCDRLQPKDGSRAEIQGQQVPYMQKPKDVDSLKPESLDVTADAVSENEASEKTSNQQSQESKRKPGTLSSVTSSIPNINFPSAAAVQSVIKSLPGRRASSKTESKLQKRSLEDLDADAFDLDASPIVSMNLALEEPRVPHGESGKHSQVSPVKETEKEAKMRKDRALEAGEATAKKPRKQIKPVISKTSIDDRTKNLAIGICSATSNAMKLLKLERLCSHLMQYPESREMAIKEKLIPALLKMLSTRDLAMREQVNEALAILGYAAPVKGRGLRILSIDGGGTRGVIAIETLREIERRTSQPIRDLFDYMMGVSSGAVLGFLLACGGASLDECEELYLQLSQEVFKRNTFLGTSKLVLSHAFYDTEGWVKILKSHQMADKPMISTARQAECPKVAAVATLMNVGSIKDFLFRNYNVPPGTQSRYRGACKYELWEAARASSAAPGYFEECKLDEYVFQDGGVLTNNPCALAIHECRLLWPDTPIQCVVSVGCGRYDPEEGCPEPEYSSLRKKLTNIMSSATDTESVHTVLQDLLPSGTYFRFNPPISEDFLLDENRAEMIQQMQQEARDYLELNELKLVQASGVLTRRKTHLHKALDWLRLQRQLRR